MSKIQSGYFFIFLACTQMLSGCGTPPSIELTSTFWENRDAKVVVAFTKLPEPAHVVTGNPETVGLLGEAIGQSAATEHIEHLKTIDFKRIHELSGRLSAILRKKGLVANNFPDQIAPDQFPIIGSAANENIAERDFSSLQKTLGAQYLLLLHVSTIGTVRGQLLFFPTFDPFAYFAASGQLIDLSSNKLLWRKQVSVTRPITKPWDQPPGFPNLTSAVDEAVTFGLNQLVLDFSWFAK